MKLWLPRADLSLAGYSALIERYALNLPLPDRLFAIGTTHSKKTLGNWEVLTPRHHPGDSDFAHLTFALKYEGLHLWVLKALFQKIAPSGGFFDAGGFQSVLPDRRRTDRRPVCRGVSIRSPRPSSSQ